MATIKIKKLSTNAIIPSYQSDEAAGFDLHSIEDMLVKAHDRVLIKTGFAMELPSGYELQVRPRSGLALKYGITLLNSPGTVDSDYRGEIMIILINHSNDDFVIKKGDRIAQGVVQAVIQAKFELTEVLSETSRGEGGFGSTGK